MSNTEIWDALGKTNPSATKGFKRAGGFSGTAIKPMWVMRRLTEQFGPCGVGWGLFEPSFQVVPGDNREVLVYCTASAWHGSKDNVVWGVGGDKVVSYVKANEQYNRPERWENDDEAFKKAFTDAIMNAFKFIGVAADVNMGRFDDNKYVEAMKREFEDGPTPMRAPSGLNVQPEGDDWYGAEGPGMTASQAKKDGWGETVDGWHGSLELIPTVEVWRQWARDNDDAIKALPKGWRIDIRTIFDRRGRELGAINQ